MTAWILVRRGVSRMARFMAAAFQARDTVRQRPALSGPMSCGVCGYEAVDGDLHLRLFHRMRAWAPEDDRGWSPR